MPSSRVNINSPQLDLEAWSKFKPQERANDFEYNLLLYKFKTFYNEVKDFQELHSNCSVSKSITNTKTTQPLGIINDKSQSSSTSSPPTVNNSITKNSLTNNRFIVPQYSSPSNDDVDRETNSSNKKFQFQNHNSTPIVESNSLKERNPLVKQTSLHQTSPQHNHQHDNNGPNVQHHNSSYNLNSITSANTVGISRKPEIKQRGHINANNNARFLLSKSSERLDSISNNNIDNNNTPLSYSPKNKDLAKFQTVNNVTTNVSTNSNFTHDDGNIYDAVSPDDDESTSSINNINRLSLPQKTKLESSKSSLGIGNITTTQDTNTKDSPYNTRGIVICKSTPLRTSNNETIDHNNHTNSFGSSLILDGTNSSSSLSILNNNKKKHNDNKFSDDYANYVNIDYFLKRSQSPSYDDGLDEDITNDDEDDSSDADDTDNDTTQLSHSVSSDQISEDVLKNMSPRELARKLSTNNREHGYTSNTMNYNMNSSTSLTPASSGDFLDDSRATNLSVANQLSPSSLMSGCSIDNNNKLGSFLASTTTNTTTNNNNNTSRESDSSGFRKKFSATSKESTTNNVNLSTHPLGLIQENKSTCNSPTSTSVDIHTNREILDKNGNALVEAHNTMRSFLSDLNLSPINDVFEDKAQRRIVKESFAVEFCGRRKLRHLFLFNDVIVCAKYQASSKQKFTFDVKWYLHLNGVSILDMNDANNQLKYDKEAIENQILAIRTNLMLLRGQMQHIKRSKHKKSSRVIKKLKKKRTELEAELVLLLPHLPLVIKNINGKKYSFFLSSNFDRNQWIESIKFLQSQLPVSKCSTLATPSSNELQAWIQTCRKNLNPSLGTFLLRSNCDDDLLYGDLYVNLNGLIGISKASNYYFCFEVDSYGHFSQKASSIVMKIDQQDHQMNEEYIFPLDGAHTLRILLYEELEQNVKPSVIGKAHIELSRAWLSDKPTEKQVSFNTNCRLISKLSYSNSELLSMRVPHAKLCPTFGLDITQVCKKEKTNVPLIIQLCVNEVERRGMREVGIYRMSGTSTDIQRLKKAFETNPYVAELLLRDIDINSVTGFLKTYLRELPEGLFSNKLYPKFVAAFNTPQTETLERTKKMLDLFHKIPIANQHTIIYLVDHLVKIYRFENYNKMSLTNLATVLGPNILRSPTESSSSSNSVDPFTAVVIGSMSQAGILYFFLNRKYSNLPLTELDSSEIERQTNATKR